MGNAVYEDREHDRWAGYGVPAICDHPECTQAIDRGLGYMCGDGVQDAGCGLFFCSAHLIVTRDGLLCPRCSDDAEPFAAKPDTAEWVEHMLTDDSWAQWRAEHPERVATMTEQAEVSRG